MATTVKKERLSLRAFLASDEAYAVWDDCHEWGDRWESGRCLFLALALQRAFPGGRLMVVWANSVAAHVVYQLRDKCLDGGGVTTVAQLLARWHREWMGTLELVPYQPGWAELSGLLTAADAEKRLARLLQQRVDLSLEDSA